MSALSILNQGLELVESQNALLETSEHSYTFQLLNNADELVRFLKDLPLPEDKKKEALVLMDRMIKCPLRRQAGRIRLIREAMNNAINKFNSAIHIMDSEPIQGE